MAAKHAADVNPGKQGSSIAPFAPVSFADWGKRGRGTRTLSPLYPGRRALSALLALGWYVSRFQRFCRFAASDMVVGSEVRKNVFTAIVVGRNAAVFRGRRQFWDDGYGEGMLPPLYPVKRPMAIAWRRAGVILICGLGLAYCG